jgi:regulator of telomere elongation helicase 1
MDDPADNNQANKRKLGVWCFNPSFCFNKLIEQKPRSVIFASGTLAPMHAYASELGQEFPVRLENDHVIDKRK